MVGSNQLQQEVLLPLLQQVRTYIVWKRGWMCVAKGNSEAAAEGGASTASRPSKSGGRAAAPAAPEPAADTIKTRGKTSKGGEIAGVGTLVEKRLRAALSKVRSCNFVGIALWLSLSHPSLLPHLAAHSQFVPYTREGGCIARHSGGMDGVLVKADSYRSARGATEIDKDASCCVLCAKNPKYGTSAQSTT